MPWWGWVSIGAAAWVIASIVCTPLMGKTIALRDRPDDLQPGR